MSDINIEVVNNKVEALKESLDEFKKNYSEDIKEIKNKLDKHNNFQGRLYSLEATNGINTKAIWFILTSIIGMALYVFR